MIIIMTSWVIATKEKDLNLVDLVEAILIKLSENGLSKTGLTNSLTKFVNKNHRKSYT